MAAELLVGLAQYGHQIDCFLPAAKSHSNVQVDEEGHVTFGAGYPSPGENVTFVWGTARFEWGRWYSRGRIAAFASGALLRGVASLRLRREVVRRHRWRPYDLIYQFSSIETPGVPAGVARAVPLVIHPETHTAGELRWLIAERRLSLRCQRPYVVAVAAMAMLFRTLLQWYAIRRASLLVCISRVFRDHMTHDYGFPPERTVVVPNPVRAGRFPARDARLGDPPVVLVLGRVAARKGIEDVVAVARALLERDANVRLRVVGGPSLWSDYTKLLEDLPSENSEYTGSVSPDEVADLLLESDVLLQASKYEPFGLTVAEALAAGVPVIATTEVGAGEGVDSSVLAAVAPGDVDGMATAIVQMLARLQSAPEQLRATARSEAERLFAPEVVCERISAALERLVEGAPQVGAEVRAGVA